MNWQYTPYNLPLMAVTLISIVLTAYVWQRRTRPGAMWLFLVMCGVVIWAASHTLQMASTSPLSKSLWNRVMYIGILAVPTGWLAFSLAYTGHGEWFRRRAGWFVIVPAATLLVIWTNPLHFWFWSGARTLSVDGFMMMETTWASGFWVHALYSYTLLFLGNVLLLRGLLSSPHTYRNQFVVVLIGCLAPWAANVLTIFRLTPFDYLDLTPFAFCITGMSLGWGLYRFRLLDVRPMALDLAVEHMRDCLFVLDDRHRLVDLNNAARSLLRSKQIVEAIGQPVVDLLPGLAGLVDQPSRGDVESVVGIDIYGSPRAYEATRISMQPQGAGWLIVMHDITARQRTEDRLRQVLAELESASKAKSHFLAHMNHELRNPLTSLMGHAEMLQMQLAGELNAGQLKSVETIIASSEQLLAMINESLDMSRIEAGRVTFYPEDFVVEDLVSEVAEHVRPIIERKGNELRLTSGDKAGSMFSDRVKTRQCLLNLLTNAAKFTADGTVALEVNHISSGNGHRAWLFVVSDTGIGISPDRQEAVFEAFSQAKEETAHYHGGTGLGLSISRNFARLMGGDIELVSEPGVGSQFTLRLPERMPQSTDAVD